MSVFIAKNETMKILWFQKNVKVLKILIMHQIKASKQFFFQLAKKCCASGDEMENYSKFEIEDKLFW